jgi:hypothetical protein
MADPVKINPPAKAPGDVSQVIDHSFIGFGVETASFPDYAGR